MIPILVESLFTLQSPFEWKGVYIPNLPPQQAKCAQGFMPMILGVHTELYKAIKKEYGVDDFDIFDLNTSDFRINNKEIDINVRRFLYDKFINPVTDYLHNKKQIEQDTYKPEFYNLNDLKTKKKNSRKQSMIENFMKFRSEIMIKLIELFKSQIFCFKIVSSEQQKNFMSQDTKQIFDFDKFIQQSKNYYIEYGNFHAVAFYKLLCDTQYFNVFISECYKYFLQNPEENVTIQFMKQLIIQHRDIKVDFDYDKSDYFVDKNDQEKFDIDFYETEQREAQKKLMLSAKMNHHHIDLYVEYVVFLAINNYYKDPDLNTSVKYSQSVRTIRNSPSSRNAYTMSALGGKIKEDIIIGLDKNKLVDLEKLSPFIFEKNLQSSLETWKKDKNQKEQLFFNEKKSADHRSNKHSPLKSQDSIGFTKSLHVSNVFSAEKHLEPQMRKISTSDKVINLDFSKKCSIADKIDKKIKEDKNKTNSEIKNTQVSDIIDFLEF